MLRKITVLATALGVVAMMAVPGGASGNWKHHQTPIQEDVQFGLTGKIRTDASYVGIECQVTTRVKLTAGSTTGHVETFSPHPTSDTANCVGMGGYAFCQIHNMAPQAVNWTLHTAPWQTTQIGGSGTQHQTAITIETQSVTFQMTGGFCPGGPFTVHYLPSTVGATCVPESCQTLTGFAMNGVVPVQLTTKEGAGPTDSGESTFSGSVEIEGGSKNTYSI
ncbi:MAG TPA: hypothetical protein VFY48_02055 [Solirubrobacterales bacterium]|nr:hypothetical protein [Solirubrobacterales bacterium]